MSVHRHVLLIDDDADLRRTLADQLTLIDDFTVEEVSTGTEGLKKVRGGDYNLVLLDIGLPDLDGREVCRLIRRAGMKMPIILLTAAATDADTILGLESGANDYVVKPFNFAVLLARMRAQLRQFEQSEDAVFRMGPYTFRPSQKLLVDEERGSQKVRLTGKETDILKYLYRAAGSVSREVLLDQVWGYNASVSTHTLETHIYRLRQKLERDPANATILITEGGGYRLRP
ncbi:response regulator transcription factor [Iodidimonas sp. SYSU 1G8]|uniref:response regulator transcription factor n=1 Tax=Iodidimonas sp. SYSU 1G8 TaxID=3133967 RepID=UPI0031FE9945